MKNIEDRRRKERSSCGFDRRRYRRVRMALDGVFFGESRSLEVREANITLRGFFIKTPMPESSGGKGVLRFFLGSQTVMLKFDVEVVWSNNDPSKGVTGMGLRICQQQDWQRKLLAASMLRRAGLAAFSSVGRPLSL